MRRMESPKLIINDKHVGLRTVGDNIYAPKNANILAAAFEQSITVDKPLTIIACFQNNSSNVISSLNHIESRMSERTWNLIVIDNGSSDNTGELIKNYISKATRYVPMSIKRVTNKNKFEDVCISYAKPFSQDAFIKFVIDPNMIFEHDSVKSFSCVGTYEVRKELSLCIYSIRCFHSEPIYVVCDTRTREYIKHKFDCANIFFDVSANPDQLNKLNATYKDQFSRLDNGLHRLDCIILKMRAMETALQNQSNTLFVDSDIIFTKEIDTPLYAEVIMSPHYWSDCKEFGVYNAGYIFTSNKNLPSTWKHLFLEESEYCEQECMHKLNYLFDTDTFDEQHNVGFWRPNKDSLKDIHSFHSHIFGQPGNREDATLSKQTLHAEYVVEYLRTSSKSIHNDIYTAIDRIKNETSNECTLKNMKGKYLSAGWAHNHMNTPIISNSQGKINLLNPTVFQSHRSGWAYAMESLIPLHSENGILFDGFLENHFGWRDPKKWYPYSEPWVGVFHNPHNVPEWFFNEYNIDTIIATDNFQKSLPYCRGIFTLSEYHAKHIRSLINIPTDVLVHPTEIPDQIFDFEQFLQNDDKKIINIGYWLRKLTSIYQLPVNSYFSKCRLLPYDAEEPKRVISELMNKEIEINNIKWTPYFDCTKTLNRVSNVEYDNLLNRNVIFLDLYDSSANNAVIECIARATPLLVNPIPAVVEYLGIDYPFYFNSLEEAAIKVKNFDLIKQTHEYLLCCETRKKLTQQHFRDSLVKSEIYQSL